MKRTPLTRKTPMPRSKALVRASEPARLEVKLPKCAGPGCRARFFKLRATQEVCGEACAQALVESRNAKAARIAEKQRKAAEKLARETDTAKREAMKGVPELKAEAQAAVNAFVRWRDQGKFCFVCQAVVLRLGGVGGGFDAGHIRARSQADHLRFDPRNVHGQCKHCNAPGSTKDHEMRAAAERLLGKEEAEALYADNRVHKWQRDELRQIRDTHRAKVRELKKASR